MKRSRARPLEFVPSGKIKSLGHASEEGKSLSVSERTVESLMTKEKVEERRDGKFL